MQKGWMAGVILEYRGLFSHQVALKCYMCFLYLNSFSHGVMYDWLVMHRI